jgi:hypothetical protein
MVTDERKSGRAAFQGMDASEQFAFFFRQHWIRVLWPFLRMLGGTILLGSAIGFVAFSANDDATRHAALIGLLVLFLGLQAAFLVRFYRHFLYVIIVTNRKIHRIKKTFLAVDDHQSIDLGSLQDIHKSQHGIVQNLFGFGTLTLEAQESVLKIHFVPKISKQYEAMLRLQGKGGSA